jgi:CHAD domain-containing protein
VAYQFAAQETVPDALRRCAREQLESAIQQLTDEIKNDPVDAVHSARKSVKKERALLRLSRGTLSAKQRKRDNKALRDAARKLSGARDADVLIQSLDQLSERFAGQLPESSFKSIRNPLVRARTTERARLRRGASHEEASEELRAVWSEIDSWKLGRDGWRSLQPGLMWTYRRGRGAYRLAQREPTLENLHEWRKRVKDLWYQLRLLGSICGPAAEGQAEEAHRLSDLLGDDHDLGVLRNAVVGMDGTAADVDGLLAMLDYRRRQLQSEALHVGQRLYAEKPGAFRRRMRRSWEAGRSQARDVAEQDPSELPRLTGRPATA